MHLGIELQGLGMDWNQSPLWHEGARHKEMSTAARKQKQLNEVGTIGILWYYFGGKCIQLCTQYYTTMKW